MSCTKKRYWTEAAAKLVLDHLRGLGKKNKKRREEDYYKCKDCGFYHLTSRKPEGRENAKR